MRNWNFCYFWENLTGKDRMLVNNGLINATNRYDQCSNGQSSAANRLTNAANGFPVTHNPTLVFSLQKKYYSLQHPASIISNYLRFIDTYT